MAFKIFRILVSALPIFFILVFGTEADECQLAVATHNKYIMGTVKPTSEIIARALAAVVMEATKMADITNAQCPEWIKGCNRLERETCRNPWFYLEKKALPTNGLTCPSHIRRERRSGAIMRMMSLQASAPHSLMLGLPKGRA